MPLSSKDWHNIGDFSEGLASVQVQVPDNSVYQGYRVEKYGYIDRSGKFVIQPRFDRVEKFSEGKALFFQTGKNSGYGFIDSKGHVVVKPKYLAAKSFSEGLAAVAIKSTDDKEIWGYINEEGRGVIEPRFQYAASFNGGLAAVNCDQYGENCKAYIDRKGKTRWLAAFSSPK